MKKFIITIFLLYFLISARAQEATLVAPGIISNDKVFGFTIKKDKAYFVNSRGGRDTMNIMESTLKNNRWSKPKTVSFSSNSNWKDIDPFITPDGKLLIFNSNRPLDGKGPVKDFDVWAVEITKNGFKEPYHLGEKVNSNASDSYATASANGNIYFGSTRDGGFGSKDIYVSENKNGKYEQALNLGEEINSLESEGNPFISPNEDYLIFAADRENNIGDSDLYISFKTGSHWSTPINLGDKINSAYAEFAPFVDPNTNTLYFTRMQRGPTMIENIYSVSINVEELRTKVKPVIKLKKE